MIPNPHGGDAEIIAKRLGMASPIEVECDFSVNLNPAGAPPALRRMLMQGAPLATSYPETYAQSACAALADAHGLSSRCVIAGNGSTEIFGWIIQALKPRRVGRVIPCYSGYTEVCEAADVPTADVALLRPETDFAFLPPASLPPDVDLVFIGSPNNPTGGQVPVSSLVEFALRAPDVTVVIDASFADFIADTSPTAKLNDALPDNVIVVKSLTKFFCIPGLRLGMAWGSESCINKLRKVQLPWSVNGLSQAIAKELYADLSYISNSRTQVTSLREKFVAQLSRLPGLELFPADADFVLLRIATPWSATSLQKALLERGILIRSCEHFEGLGPEYVRLAVRPVREQELLITALKELLADSRTATSRVTPSHTPAIMVVGTTSDAGKSIVAAGICRSLARRGLSVAPFKAQNMALNSFVTAEGGEMGRAQVTQAAAAGVEPHTDMNPVLLKPLGETIGSQVIVDGHAIGNFKAREYYSMKSRMRAAAHAAYDRLAGRHDFIVLEGAGSPAEINLMEEDFVNMDMAAYAHARTLLVADIDRGGVFASILGTITLLPERHRRWLSGIIINKFRGDPSLLDSGIRDIEAMTGIPVLGVVPYLKDLSIEEEDSLGLERAPQEGPVVLDVVVVRLPRISNFTDFLAMEQDQGVRVRYAATPQELGSPDLLILPGTKNTRTDLQWLHHSGFADSIHALQQADVPIIGICGGYQMLGNAVHDDHGVEGEAGETRGLEMLPVTTHLVKEKELAQVEAVTREGLPFVEPGVALRGYEIHAGESSVQEEVAHPLSITRRRGVEVDEPAGALAGQGHVFGCYIHGIFDAPQLRKGLWSWLCRRKGVPPSSVTISEHSELAEFNRLADHLEAHVRLDEVTQVLSSSGSR